jgi:hypothetical protein
MAVIWLPEEFLTSTIYEMTASGINLCGRFFDMTKMLTP